MDIVPNSMQLRLIVAVCLIHLMMMMMMMIVVVTDQNKYRWDDPIDFLAARRRRCRLQSHPFGSTPIPHIHGSSRIRRPKINANMSVRCFYGNIMVAAATSIFVTRCRFHDTSKGSDKRQDA
jgi:hypothetical protein